jgi:hypothetical protein
MDLQVVYTDDGKDEVVQYLCGLLPGGFIKYFKLGEGGWIASALHQIQIDTGDGTAVYTGTLPLLPAIANEVDIIADPGGGSTQTLTDDGAGGFTGDGTGTINYKTGAYAVTFNADVTIGLVVRADFKTRGAASAEQTQVLGLGDGTKGPYNWAVLKRPIDRGSLEITERVFAPDTPLVITDNGDGTLGGDGSGFIDYDTGELVFEFSAPIDSADEMVATWEYEGAPKDPDPTKTDLESESDPDLHTFQKDFAAGDITSLGAGTGQINCRVFLDLFEGIDDGNGDPPYYFEGGIFSENDVLVAYFTMSAVGKDGSTLFDDNIIAVL